MLTTSTVPLLSKKGCEKLVNTRTVVAMVGLPGTAKTFLSRKVSVQKRSMLVSIDGNLHAGARQPRFLIHRMRISISMKLAWTNISNAVGEDRSSATLVSDSGDVVFDLAHRDKIERMLDVCLDHALSDVCEWLKSGHADLLETNADSSCNCPRGSIEDEGEVAIIDATNSRRERRQRIKECAEREGFKLFFVEIVCDSPHIFTDPTSAQAKGGQGLSFDDMQVRINYFKHDYEPLCPAHDGSFIKVINIGQKFVVNKLQGRVPSRVVYYLMNLKVLPNPVVYIVRHGESHFNTQCRIGGDSQLTNRGKQFASRLSEYFYEHASSHTVVFTSTYRRTIQTAAKIDAHKQHWGALDEISAGLCDGLTYYEIASKYPDEFLRRDNDKYYYRYPQGESYQDLVARLEPVILAIERMESVLVICHQAVARCLIGYFRGIAPELTPYIPVPLHTVVRISPGSYGVTYEEIALGVDCVDTHRPRPQNLNASRTIEEALSTVSQSFRSNQHQSYDKDIEENTSIDVKHNHQSANRHGN
ncbi:hypothetical protein ACOME3_008604 [Neoechinorhynchus agilis]